MPPLPAVLTNPPSRFLRFARARFYTALAISLGCLQFVLCGHSAHVSLPGLHEAIHRVGHCHLDALRLCNAWQC